MSPTIQDLILAELREHRAESQAFRQEMGARVSVLEAEQLATRARLTALEAETRSLTLAPGAAALSGWRHVLFVVLGAVCLAAFGGMAMALRTWKP